MEKKGNNENGKDKNSDHQQNNNLTYEIKFLSKIQTENVQLDPNIPKEQTISILSYNLLANSLAMPEWFLYNSKESEFLKFQNRFLLNIQILQRLNSDIVCLQEVDQYENNYRPALEKMNYTLKLGINMLIGYKKDKFELLEEVKMDYNAINPNKYLKKTAFYFKEFMQLLHLKHIKTNIQFYIENTHIFWSPKHEEVKYFQGVFLQKYFNEKCQPNENIIICGDFNSMPQSNLVKFILNKTAPELTNIEEQFRAICNLQEEKEMFKAFINICKIKFQSAYNNYSGTQTHPKFTNYTKQFKGNLDYIFYNQDSKNIRLHSILELPSEELLKLDCQAIPNSLFGSDHLPILANFYLI